MIMGDGRNKRELIERQRNFRICQQVFLLHSILPFCIHSVVSVLIISKAMCKALGHKYKDLETVSARRKAMQLTRKESLFTRKSQ